MMRRLFFPVIAALAIAGCGSKTEPASVEAKSTPVAVHTAMVSQADWPAFYDAVGTVRARTAAQVSGRIMGVAREVQVRVGDRVRQGQVLVVVDARDLDARERQANAGLAEVHSAEAEAQNAIESAKANLQLAESTFRRMKDLHDKTSISDQEFDEASARVRVAKAGLDMALARRKQVESKIAQATEETNAARIQQGYATIVAPFAGVVTEKIVEPGNMVTPGAPLMTVEREGSYRLEASVEEANLGRVRLGMRTTVSLDSLDRILEGTVSEIVPAVDASSRAFIAKVDLPGNPNIRTGLFGRARFATGQRSIVAVPLNAVVQRGQMQWVFVADGDTARGRIVTLGQRYQDQAEVLSGLKAGEKIVTPVPQDLADGAKLEVRP